MALAAKGLEGIIANESKLSNVQGSEESYVIWVIPLTIWLSTHLLKKLFIYITENFQINQNLIILRTLSKPTVIYRTESLIFSGCPKDAGPMDVIRTAVSMLGLYDTKGDHQNRELNEQRAIAIIAKTPLIVAAFHRFRQGLEIIETREDLNEAAHFLYLINGEVPSEDAAKTLDVAYILHADHGMNASTFSSESHGGDT